MGACLDVCGRVLRYGLLCVLEVVPGGRHLELKKESTYRVGTGVYIAHYGHASQKSGSGNGACFRYPSYSEWFWQRGLLSLSVLFKEWFWQRGLLSLSVLFKGKVFGLYWVL